MGYHTKQITQLVVYIHPETAYINKQTSRLMDTYLVDDNKRVYNTSIDSRFYSTELYDTLVQDSSNELESSWKQRLLIESTPRGSVAMYYDAFKQGFAYYSDQYIPYSIVNAVAMKYVVIYRCRDFFLDETVLFYEKRSPFLDIQEEGERLEKDKKMLANKEKGLAAIDVKKGPFAKLKQYSTTSGDVLPNTIHVDGKAFEKKTNLDTKEYMKNRMIHLGKWSNMTILNKTGLKDFGKALKKLPEIPLKFKEYMALKVQLKP
jgi:hypothetical protein